MENIVEKTRNKNMRVYTIRHLLEDGTSEDVKVDVSWEMEEVQAVYPTRVRFDDIPMVKLDNVGIKPHECIGVYDILDSWDFDKMRGWISKQAKEQSLPIRMKTSLYVMPEKVISGVVPVGDWWVAYNDDDYSLGQIEVVEGDGKVHRGTHDIETWRNLTENDKGYGSLPPFRAEDDYLKPSASVIEEKLKPYGQWRQSNNIGEWYRCEEWKDLTWMHQEMVAV